MREELLHILSKHGEATADPGKRSELGKFVRHKAVESIVKGAVIDKDKYLVRGSVGQTLWAEIPWIFLADKSITTTAQRGYYIVYLFRQDLSGVYLSLNQGWTFFKDLYGTKEAKSRIQIVAMAWRNRLKSYKEDFDLSTIDLRGKGNLATGYELGHICGKFYPTNKTPDDLALINDLRALVGVYKELKGIIGKRNVDQFTESLAEGEFLPPLLDDEEKDDFNQIVNRTEPAQTTEEPQTRPPEVKRGGKSSWARNPEKASEALQLAKYQCEYGKDHKSFISLSTNNNFVEAHHLIPMRLQRDFKYSIDVPGNIVALCPNCHRAIHHAGYETKSQMISTLFNYRRDKLTKFGISITMEKLLETYGLKL